MKTVHLLAWSIAFASLLGAQTAGRSSIEGQVVSSVDGTPVRRATVTLQLNTGHVAMPGQPPLTMLQGQVETDDQGRFAFHDLVAGGYRVTVQRQGFVPRGRLGRRDAGSRRSARVNRAIREVREDGDAWRERA